MLMDFGEFLKRLNDEEVAYLQLEGNEHYVYAVANGDYTFHFSVQTQDEEVIDIHARKMEWIQKHVVEFEYVMPPTFVRTAVDNRVEIVEDPIAFGILYETCDQCQEEHLADVRPKMDLLVDGKFAQRVTEEYCPECGTPMIDRTTVSQPRLYEWRRFNEDAPPEDQFEITETDINSKTWEHSRV